MSEATNYVADRTSWPSGPWDGEPDKLNWRTESGLPGMIVRGPHGSLCGYVAVTEGHPCFGLDYMQGYEIGEDGERDYDREIPNPVKGLHVHGGITYGERCAGHICHVPEPGEPDDVWWLGFDCSHSGDITPKDAMYYRRQGLPVRGEYRDIAYVRAEVEGLARQLADLAVSP